MIVATPLRRLPDAGEAPLRSALYSADQMERHGEDLARVHKLCPGRRLGPRGDRLLERLTDNEGVLVATGELLKAALTAGQPIAPAGEWLLDNFHLIEAEARNVQRDLPPRYYMRLPRLAGSADRSRVEALAGRLTEGTANVGRGEGARPAGAGGVGGDPPDRGRRVLRGQPVEKHHVRDLARQGAGLWAERGHDDLEVGQLP